MNPNFFHTIILNRGYLLRTGHQKYDEPISWFFTAFQFNWLLPIGVHHPTDLVQEIELVFNF